MDRLKDWIRLTKTGASARRLNLLLDHYGSPEALFDSDAGTVALTLGCRRSTAEKILDPTHQATDSELRLMERLGINVLTRGAPDYPSLLAQISDPPPALYCRGELRPEDSNSVALVGSRRCGDYGKRMAEQLGRALAAAGVTVISGLARGIDTAAHRGALAEGRTIACTGCGADVIYPSENGDLIDRIIRSGAVVTEYPPGAKPDSWHFPARNRIISGLSLGVVVVEAPARSGALITTDFAAEQGREVFAVPGRIDDGRSEGANRLIQDGAKLVQSVADILEELRPCAEQLSLRLELEAVAPRVPRSSSKRPKTPEEPSPKPNSVELTEIESTLLELLGEDPVAIDDLILEAGLPAQKVTSTLLMLELKGLSRRLAGNLYSRV